MQYTGMQLENLCVKTGVLMASSHACHRQLHKPRVGFVLVKNFARDYRDI